MTTNVRYPIVLPSETQSREFDAKLLLARFLAERGHPVYVGSRIEIHKRIHTLPIGLYLAKDIRSPSRRIFRILRRLGFQIAAWDEEAFIFTDEATYHKKRVNSDNLNQLKAFFALSETNKTMVESAPGYHGTPVHVTGNPRIDMLSRRCRGFFDPDVAVLRERFGNFILINSNFGQINHFLPSAEIARLTELVPAFWNFRLAVFEAFKELLPVLAQAFPDHQIVLRPHPSESHDTWREAAKGAPNVHVVHEGSVQPWIAASAVAIHNGCTTGLESYLLDHPVIVYQPVTSDEFDDMLTNRAGTSVFSQDELIETVGSVLGGGNLAKPGKKVHTEVEQFFGPLDGTLASERMVEIIAEEGDGWFGTAPTAIDRFQGWAESVGRSLVKSINAYRPGHKNSRAYNQHRFPGLSEAEVAERLDRLGSVLGNTSRLKVRQVGGNIFCISDQ